MIAEISEFDERMAELLKQVQAGNEIVLTHDSKPVAKLVSASEEATIPSTSTSFQMYSLRGHRVLTPAISQAELAEEMFGNK